MELNLFRPSWKTKRDSEIYSYTLHKIFVCIIFVIVFPLTATASFEGPLQVKNLYPIFLHVDQPYLEKAVMENSMSYSLSHSSTHTVQESNQWLIALDMEITELNFRYRRIIKGFAELNLDIPVLFISNGFMDSFLESYHDAFDFPDYGRSLRPHNEFLYEVKRDGRLIIQGESGIGIGDIRFALKRPLMYSDDFKLSIKADVEVPVSNAEKGYSNGSIDAGLSLLFDKTVTEGTMTYWNLGVVFPGDIKGHDTLDLKNFVYGGAAVETGFLNYLDLVVQLMWQSTIYPETDIVPVDREACFIVIGGRYATGEKSYELSLTEDISTSGAPDFILNFTYKVNM